MFYGFYGPYPILIIISMVISFAASSKVNTNYRRYSAIRNRKGITGSQAARMILDANGLQNVRIEMQGGVMTDHYDPSTRVIRLSQGVCNESTIAAVSIAAHEVGHAIQHQQSYSMLVIRNAIALPVSFASRASWVLIVFGLIMTGAASSQTGNMLIDIGIILFAAVVVFHLVTLPVETDASRRAMKQMEASGILYEDEMRGAGKMLRAAAFTYLAALAVALFEMIRLLALRRND